VFDGEHEAIIPGDVFQQVQTLLQRNGRTGGAEVRSRYGALLRGLLVCGNCDHTMFHNFTGRGGKRYRYYTCTRAIKKGRKKCPSGSLPAPGIERVVVDQIRCIADDPALRDAVLQQACEKNSLESVRAAYRCIHSFTTLSRNAEGTDERELQN
jgi:site-specific DNA recombinase